MWITKSAFLPLCFLNLLVTWSNGHLVLTYPKPRGYPLDFLDNGRTQGPCGMPKDPDLVTYTNLQAGSDLDLTWHYSYPHKGGVYVELLDHYNHVLQRDPPTGWMLANDVGVQHYTMTLPSEPCVNCSIRVVKLAGEWSTRTSNYVFWSCADVNILAEGPQGNERCSNHGRDIGSACLCERLYTGDRCQYKNECEDDSDCGSGTCIDTMATSYPKLQCYCPPGFFGRQCEKVSPVKSKSDIKLYNYRRQKLGQGFEIFYRIIPDINEVEVMMRAQSVTWIALGWRSYAATYNCRRFPLETQDKLNDGYDDCVEGEDSDYEPNSEPGQPTSEPNSEPGQPSSEPNSEPGQPTSEPNSEPGQPSSEPNSEPGQPSSEPNSEPGQPSSEPNSEPGQPSSEPNSEPGQPSSEPNSEPGYSNPEPNSEPGHSSGEPSSEPGSHRRRRCRPRPNTGSNTDSETHPETNAEKPAHPETSAENSTQPEPSGGHSTNPETSAENSAQAEPSGGHSTNPETSAENSTQAEPSGGHSTNPETSAENSTQAEPSGGHSTNPETSPENKAEPNKCDGYCLGGEGCLFDVMWQHDPATQTLKFTVNVTLSSSQYFAIGLSPDTIMPGSDIIVGWVNGDTPFLSDRWASGRNVPIVDSQQDVEIISGSVLGGETVMVFRRPLNSSDFDDVSLGGRCIHILTARGDKQASGAISYHGYGDDNRQISSKVCFDECPEAPGTVGEPSATGEPSQGTGEPSQGTGEPSQGTGEPNQGTGEPNQGTGEPNQGTGEPNQGTGEPNQGTGEPNHGTGEPNQGTGEPSGEPSGEPNGEPNNRAEFHDMDCTDIVVGTARAGLSRIGDYYTRDRSTPLFDDNYGGTDGLTAALGYEEGSTTTILFRRKLTSEDPADWDIENGQMHVIWARGQQTGDIVHNQDSALEDRSLNDPNYYRQDELKYHGGRPHRGVSVVNFRFIPRSVLAPGRGRKFKVPGSIKLKNLKYDDYSDLDSPASKELVRTLKPTLEASLKESIANFRDVIITGFRQGSVIVDFIVEVEGETGQETQIKTEMTEALSDFATTPNTGYDFDPNFVEVAAPTSADAAGDDDDSDGDDDDHDDDLGTAEIIIISVAVALCFVAVVVVAFKLWEANRSEAHSKNRLSNDSSSSNSSNNKGAERPFGEFAEAPNKHHKVPSAYMAEPHLQQAYDNPGYEAPKGYHTTYIA